MKKYPAVQMSDITMLITDGKHGDCQDEENSGFFFLSSKDLQGGRLHYDRPREIRQNDFLETHRRTNLKPGDILLANCGASIGRVGIAQQDDRIYKTTFQKSISVIKADERYVDNKYLYYFFKGNSKYLVDLGGGTAQPNLLISDLRRIKLQLPPLPVQRKIAAILSAYDDLIENNQRRIALLERMAEELYRGWFVRMRFPGHAQVKFEKGVPEGWEKRKLGDAFTFTGGGTPSKEVGRYWENGEINWFTPSDITAAEGIFLEQSGDRCTEEGLAQSSARLFPAYSVMMTSRATIGAIGINTTPACTNQGFITCIPNERFPLVFLYYWLKLSKPHFELLSGGATFAELTKGTFKKIEMIAPPSNTMAAFEEKASPIFRGIEMRLKENRNLVATRNMLLSRLISGKLSVETLDIQFPPRMLDDVEQTVSEARP